VLLLLERGDKPVTLLFSPAGNGNISSSGIERISLISSITNPTTQFPEVRTSIRVFSVILNYTSLSLVSSAWVFNTGIVLPRITMAPAVMSV